MFSQKTENMIFKIDTAVTKFYFLHIMGIYSGVQVKLWENILLQEEGL